MSDELNIEAFKAAIAYRIIMDSDHGEADGSLLADPFDVIKYARSVNRNSMPNLTIERTLRQCPGRRKLYFDTLSQVSVELTVAARAASSSEIATRTVGRHQIEIEKEDDTQYLIVNMGYVNDDPWLIEVRLTDGEGMRVQLGRPINGTITLRATKANESINKLIELILNPTSLIWLTHTVED